MSRVDLDIFHVFGTHKNNPELPELYLIIEIV